MQVYSVQRFADLLKTTSYSDGRTRTMKEGADGVITVNLVPLDATEKALARAALQEIGTITGLDFAETGGNADISYLNSGSGANTKTTARGDTILSATVNIAASRVDPGDAPGSFAFRTYMHETAHALGLGHPQDYGSVTRFEDSKIANDSWQISLMSYFDQVENTHVDASKSYNLTPMIADYVALRQMYGAVPIRNGDTVYGVGSTAGGSLEQAARLEGRVAFLIADSGGTDRLVFSTTTAAQRIDLRAGAISDVMGGRGNMQIASDTTIENAVAGAGADLVQGNVAANRLVGGAGNDTLFGFGGDDVLNGGAGSDRLVGGTGNDLYIVDRGDRVVESAGGGIDTVRSAVSFALAAHVENLTLTGTVAANATGNGQANRLTGNGSANILEGGGGNDVLDGGAGVDTARFSGAVNVTVNLGLAAAQNTGHGLDQLVRIENVTSGMGHDRLIGNGQANTLISGAGNDLLNGGGGRDRMMGGAGNDRYVTDGGDRILEAAGQGRDTVSSSVTHALGANLEDLELTGGAAANGWGNTLDNRITGNRAANALLGGAGDDTLRGGGGADRLTGGAGTDLMDGGAGDGARDTFIFNRLSDSARGASRDVIRNFEDGFDTIDLRPIDANTRQDGDQAFRFGGETRGDFSVWYVAGGNSVIVRADVNGDAAADFELRLDGISRLDAGDFLL